MMKDLFLIGAGGFCSEVLHLIELIEEREKKWNAIYLIDDTIERFSKELRGYTVIGGLETIIKTNKEIDVVITINDTNARKRIVESLEKNNHVNFPNLISPLSLIDSKYLNIGYGNIIMHYVILSTQLEIGNFNSFNSYTGIGHDTRIGNFNSFGPRVAISGNVQIGNLNDFGVNSTVLQKKKIGNNNQIWLNTSILKSITDNNIYFGIPGKKVYL